MFKKITIILLLVVSFALVGCNNDSIVGTWSLTKYEASINNTTFDYTIEEIQNFVYDPNLPSTSSDEEKVKNVIAQLNSYFKDLKMEFKENREMYSYINNTTSEANEWRRNGTNIITKPKQQTQYSTESVWDNSQEGVLFTTQTMNNIQIKIIFIKD